MPANDTVMRSITHCAGDAAECHARPRRKSRAVRTSQSHRQIWAVQVHDADIGTRPDSVYLFLSRKSAISYYRKCVQAYRYIGTREQTDYAIPISYSSKDIFGRTVFENPDGTDTTFIVKRMPVDGSGYGLG